MTRSRLRFLLMALFAIASFSFAACGDDDSDSASTPSGGGTQATADVPEGKRGGKLIELAASDVDKLDPGYAYYQFGFQVIYAMHRTLYGYSPDDPLKAKPDLADGEPVISPDGLTVTVKMKKGVKFSPPVNREITSKDVKYAIERFFSVNVGGGYTAYFKDITGAPDANVKGIPDIEGIETPDDQTLVFKLDKKVAPQLVGALVMPITAPVPEEFAAEFDAKSPSTYDKNIVASGPYMIPNDAKGKLTGYQPSRKITLVRNPNWDAKTDFKPAYLDEIEIRTNVSDANVAARQVLNGDNVILDTNPPAEILPQLQRPAVRDQFTQVPSGGYRYFPMNTTIPPFDDINVRKAVNAIFDREAAVKARGGSFAGVVANHYLPPDFPGHEEAGGLETTFDFMKNPRGDAAVAAKYMKAAGYASGKYEGDDEVFMVTANVDPGKAQAEVAKEQLEKLGFKVTLRTVPQDAVYTEFCQVPDKKVNMCGAAGWFKDFLDPQSMLEPTFKGSEIRKGAGPNNNLPQLNVPAIDKAMDEAAVLTGEERLKAWAAIDLQIVEQAATVPFIWDKTTLIWGKGVNGVADPYNSLLSLAYTSLK